MNGMSQYLMLLSAHCCKASLKISWDRRCANSQTTVSDPEDSFASSLLTREGVLGGTLSPDMKLSALACRLSLSIVVGNGNVCFDFMQPMLGRASTARSTAVSGKDYFSIFGKHQPSVPVVTDPCFSTPGRFRAQCPRHHSSHEVFIRHIAGTAAGQEASGAGRAPCPGRSPELPAPALLPGAGWRRGEGEPRPGQERSAAQSKGSGAASSPANGSVKWQQLEDRASLGRAPGPSLLRRCCCHRARGAYLAGSRPTPDPLGPAGGSRGAIHSRRGRVPGVGRARSLVLGLRVGGGRGAGRWD